MASGSHAQLDVSQLQQHISVRTLSQQVSALSQQAMSSEPCIYKVVPEIRDLHPEAYSPKVVGLGLFHLKNTMMEDRKDQAVTRTLRRIKWKIEDLVGSFLEKVDEIRGCYKELDADADAKDYSKKDIAKKVVEDSCFILDFYRYFDNNMEKDKRQSLAIMTDIYKLENQIPLLVLKEMLQKHGNTDEEATRLLAEMLITHPLFSIRPSHKIIPFALNHMASVVLQSKVEEHIKKGAHHLLDLLTKMITDFLTINQHQPMVFSYFGLFASDYSDIYVPHTVQLKKYGFKFQNSTEGKVRFVKTCYNSKVLYLPQIILHEHTKSILQNLMVFVDMSNEETIICQFIILINSLIRCKGECVAPLLNQGIISYGGFQNNEEIANNLKGLCNGILEKDTTHFKTVLDQVREHCNQVNLFINQFLSQLTTASNVIAFIAVLISIGILVGGMLKLKKP